MRALPYFAGAVAMVAVGGAVAGGAIDTTPRQLFDSESYLPKSSAIAFDDANAGPGSGVNHYAIEADGETYEVAELRERGLYSQDRYAPAYYDRGRDGADDTFDFAAAEAEQRAWEGEQFAQADRTAPLGQSRSGLPAQRRALELERPAKVARAQPGGATRGGVRYVSQPVVQDTTGMAR